MTRLAWTPAVLALACSASTPAPCNGSTCPATEECLAQRCVTRGHEPVPRNATRVVLEPTAMALVSSERPDAHLPAVVRLGHQSQGDIRWFLRFRDDWQTRGNVASAFLLLEPAPGDGSSEDITVSAWLVRGEWYPATLTWRTRPEIGRPSSKGLARSRPPTTLRIDVTELAREMASVPDHGIALAAVPSNGHGAGYFSGVAGGAPPRLELYLQKPRPAP